MKLYSHPTQRVPTDEQFVAMWNFGGKVWCSEFRVDGGALFRFNEDYDEWRPTDDDQHWWEVIHSPTTFIFAYDERVPDFVRE